jgi:hypothetical protein
MRLRIQPLTEETNHNLFSANGTQLKLLGTADVTLDISELKIPHTFYICENLTESVILGRTFLADASAVIDFKNRTITVSDTVQLPLLHKISRNNFVRAKESMCIQPNTEVIFPVQCARKFNNQTILVTPVPGEQFRRFAIANAICRVVNGQTVCRLFNCTDKCLVICANQKIAHAETFDDYARCLTVSNKPELNARTDDEQTINVDEATLNSFANEYGCNINPKLSAELRLKLLRILFKRKEAFAKTVDDLKCYNKEQFEVHLKNSRPLIQRQFKHKPEHAIILQSIVDSWEKNGIVEPSTNYYFRNPIFLVPKSSLRGASDPLNQTHYRSVLDLRSLNNRVEKLVTFSPSTNDLIQQIMRGNQNSQFQYQKPVFFSSFDFLSGFHQLELKKGISRECFSFTSPDGSHKQFTRVPFSYVNSPHLFNATVGRLMAPMRATGAFSVNVDDSLIYTASAEEHLQRIDQFLAILIENNLKCSTKKSFLMQNEIRYLGLELSHGTIKVPQEVNRAIDRLLNLKMTSVKAVQRLLGYLQFWRYHIKNLAQRTFNIRQLVRKDNVFRWTAECEKERQDVLNALRNAQPLSAIDPNKPLYLMVDSSAVGIGATICQTDESAEANVDKQLSYVRNGQPRLQPVMHLSWALTPAQARLPSTSLELIGLYRCLSSLEHLFTTRDIHVISDNVGVSAFHKLEFSNPRERRLLAYLQQFSIHVHYCKGSKHMSADYLSRLPADLPPAERVLWTKTTEEDERIIDNYLFAVGLNDAKIDAQNTSNATEQQWTLYLMNERGDDSVAQAATNNQNPIVVSQPDSEGTPSSGRGASSATTAHQRQSASDNGATAGQRHRVDNLSPSGQQSCLSARSVKPKGVNNYQPAYAKTDARDTNKDDNTASANLHETQAQKCQRIPRSYLNANATPFVPTNVEVVDVDNQYLNVANVNQVPDAAAEEEIDFGNGLLTSAPHNNITTHDDFASTFHEQYGENKATVNATKKVPKRDAHLRQVDQSVISDPTAPENTQTTANLDDERQNIVLPTLTGEDYDDDPEFGDVWRYLTLGELSGDRNRDYRVVLLAPLFTIEDNQLYRFTEPRSRKRAADGSVRKVLAIPQKFQQAILIDLHKAHGHAAAERLFQAARLSIHFKNLYSACFEVSKSCILCQQVKIDKSKQIPELHSTPIFRVGEVFFIDHKVLPRKTPEGFTAILAMVESFSGFCYFEAVKDQSASTTAEVLVRRIYANHPNIKGICSDKHPGFMSQLFKILTQKVLGLTHWSSSSLNPQSHGLVEANIKQMSVLINLLAEDDMQIPQILPLAEMMSRLSISKPRGYSP